jgi:DNA transposition AAA+ family ATPase
MATEEKEKIINEELYQKFFSIVGIPEEGKKISQARAARELRVSSAVISFYKNRNYKGNYTALEENIQAFLVREERRMADITIPIVETTTIENTRIAFGRAHDHRNIAVVVGEAGTGKSTAISKYEAENPGAVLVIYGHPAMTQQKLIVNLALLVGVYSKRGGSMLIERIVDELRGRDIVLIVDQADYLTDGALELLRCITTDMARIGLVLVGLPRLEAQLKNLRNDHQQLLSRVGTFLKIKVKSEDAEKIIKEVWENVSKEVVGELVKMAGGSIRVLTELIMGVSDIMAKYRKEEPTYDMVISAGGLLIR